MTIGADVEVRIVPESPPVEALGGRYWLFDDALYAEINRANKRFYLVEDVTDAALVHHVKRVLSYRSSVPTAVTMKWCSECPYNTDDTFWIGWLEHSANLRFQNFLQRRATARERVRAEQAAIQRAAIEDSRRRREQERAAAEQTQRLRNKEWAAERERVAEEAAANRQMARLACVEKLSDALHIDRSNGVQIALIKGALDALPVPEDMAEHLSKLDNRSKAVVLACANGITLKHIGAFFNVASSRIGQIRDKAHRRIARWKQIKGAERTREAILNPPQPVLEFYVGPLMEWTAEMQAAEIAAERG